VAEWVELRLLVFSNAFKRNELQAVQGDAGYGWLTPKKAAEMLKALLLMRMVSYHVRSRDSFSFAHHFVVADEGKMRELRCDTCCDVACCDG